MIFKIVAVSYMASLIANTVLLLGGVSLIMWIKREPVTNFIGKHKTLLSCIMGDALIILAYMQLWVNQNAATTLVGFHWAYFNVMLVATFNLLIYTNNRGQMLYTMIGTAIWPLSGTITVALVVETLGLLVVTYFTYCGVDRIMHSRLLYTVLFVVYSAIWLAMTNDMFGHQSRPAWGRQIVALIVLNLVVVGYYRMLRHQLDRMDTFQHQAQVDELTDAYTFAMFTEKLADAFTQFQQDGKLYAVFTLDIDHFKRVNDTYGHLAGNKVLTAVAHQIEHVVESGRYAGQVYRTGGEEFTVILHNIREDDQEAETMLRTVHAAVGTLVFTFDRQQLRVTISLGGTHVSSEDTNYLQVYKRADQYLYDSKRHGRDAVTLRGRTLAR